MEYACSYDTLMELNVFEVGKLRKVNEPVVCHRLKPLERVIDISGCTEFKIPKGHEDVGS